MPFHRENRRGDRLSHKQANAWTEGVEDFRAIQPFIEDPWLRNPIVPPDLRWVQISSTTKISGRYPGYWYSYDAATRTWTQEDVCWVDPPNSGTLNSGVKYLARAIDVIEPTTATLALTGTPTGGTFQITVDGDTTTNFPYNETAANIQTELRTISGQSTTTVTGTAPTWEIIWTTAPSVVTTNASGLTGGTSPAVVFTAGPSAVYLTEVEPAAAGSDGETMSVYDSETKYECESDRQNEYKRSKTINLATGEITYGSWIYQRCIGLMDCNCGDGGSVVDPPIGERCLEYSGDVSSLTELTLIIAGCGCLDGYWCLEYAGSEVVSTVPPKTVHTWVSVNPGNIDLESPCGTGVDDAMGFRVRYIEETGCWYQGYGGICGVGDENGVLTAFPAYPVPARAGYVMANSPLEVKWRWGPTTDDGITCAECVGSTVSALLQEGHIGCSPVGGGGGTSACPDGDGSTCVDAINLGGPIITSGTFSAAYATYWVVDIPDPGLGYSGIAFTATSGTFTTYYLDCSSTPNVGLTYWTAPTDTPGCVYILTMPGDVVSWGYY